MPLDLTPLTDVPPAAAACLPAADSAREDDELETALSTLFTLFGGQSRCVTPARSAREAAPLAS